MLRVAEEAAQAGLIESASDGTAFRFVHALVHKALYESAFPCDGESCTARSPRRSGSGPCRPRRRRQAFLRRCRRSGGERLVQAGHQAELVGALLTTVEQYESALQRLDEC